MLGRSTLAQNLKKRHRVVAMKKMLLAGMMLTVASAHAQASGLPKAMTGRWCWMGRDPALGGRPTRVRFAPQH